MLPTCPDRVRLLGEPAGLPLARTAARRRGGHPLRQGRWFHRPAGAAACHAVETDHRPAGGNRRVRQRQDVDQQRSIGRALPKRPGATGTARRSSSAPTNTTASATTVPCRRKTTPKEPSPGASSWEERGYENGAATRPVGGADRGGGLGVDGSFSQSRKSRPQTVGAGCRRSIVRLRGKPAAGRRALGNAREPLQHQR